MSQSANNPKISPEGLAAESSHLTTEQNVDAALQAKTQLLEAERFATLGRLLSGIAHDVGTPLNIISGYSEFLLMRLQSGDPGHKELTAILQQTRRIAKLFEEALDLARLPTGRIDAIEIKPVLERVLNLASHFLRKASVKAGLTCAKTPPLIYGEASQLTQALFNLLLNACAQIEGGKLEILIEERPERTGFLTLAFCGIDAAGRGHDFSESLGGLLEPNRTAITSGLGLSLARDLFEVFGAEVSAGEEPDRGVAILLHLPVGSRSI